MKQYGKRILSLLLAALLILSAAKETVPACVWAYTDSAAASGDASGNISDDASGDASESGNASGDASESDGDGNTNQTKADVSDEDNGGETALSDIASKEAVPEDTVSDQAASSVTSYSYSYTYTTLNEVTLTPSSETISAVSTALISFMSAYEGDYDTVSCDDNGSLSIGMLQWHGSNALLLMRLIISADNSAAYSALGEDLYNEIISSSASWSSRTLSSSEASKISECINTSTGRSIQDKLAASCAADYINSATSLGIRNASAILIYSDVYNQRGISGAKTTAAAAAGLAGSYSAVTGNEMLIASIACYPTTGTYYKSFVKRRLACYQTAVDLGWTCKLSADYLIPTSQTAAESTAVSWVQHTLNMVSSASLTVNGTYDSATVAAVTAFQTAQGLTADGETGLNTIAALCEALYDYMTDNALTSAAMLLGVSSSAASSSSSSSSSSSGSTSTAASTLKISSYNYPKTIKKGNSYSIKGTIKSNYKITKVTVQVLNAKGKVVLSASANPNKKTYKLQTALDAKIRFGKLSAGKYTYKVTATDAKTTKTLVKKTFKVRSLTISGAKSPTTIKKGSSFTIKGTVKSGYKITKVTVQILNAKGKVVLSASVKPNKKSCSLQAKLDAKIKFSKLKKGTYTYKVIASDTKTSNVTLLKKTFKVK